MRFFFGTIMMKSVVVVWSRQVVSGGSSGGSGGGGGGGVDQWLEVQCKVLLQPGQFAHAGDGVGTGSDGGSRAEAADSDGRGGASGGATVSYNGFWWWPRGGRAMPNTKLEDS